MGPDVGPTEPCWEAPTREQGKSQYTRSGPRRGHALFFLWGAPGIRLPWWLEGPGGWRRTQTCPSRPDSPANARRGFRTAAVSENQSRSPHARQHLSNTSKVELPTERWSKVMRSAPAPSSMASGQRVWSDRGPTWIHAHGCFAQSADTTRSTSSKR